jgi:hypothetical protein
MGDFFEVKSASRGEFEALRRFPDYEELADGTLSRVEGTEEFRIIRDGVEGNSLMHCIMTAGLLAHLQEFKKAMHTGGAP